MKTDYNKGDLLVVHWHDITACENWLSQEVAENYATLEIVSCGWFLNNNDGNLRMARTVCNDECDVIVIPLSVIDSIQKATYKRK